LDEGAGRGVAENLFDLSGRDPMLGDVLDIPILVVLEIPDDLGTWPLICPLQIACLCRRL
jgi:hypothetical protein